MREESKKSNVRGIMASGSTSAFEKYKMLTAGDVSLIGFVYYELVTMVFGPMPGALGLLLRKKLYRRLFKKVGGNLIIGRNCVIRSPGRISIGDNVVIDDNVLVDARGCDNNGMVLHDDVMVNRNCVLISKGGDITIEKNVSIGSGSQFVSWSGISIGEGTAIAGGCIISGGTYKLDDFDTPIAERTPISAGSVDIGSNVWIATRVTILDGVKIGNNSILSAGCVVTSKVEEKAVVHGNPAKMVFQGR